MFINHVSPQQLQQILQKNLLGKIIQPSDQIPKKKRTKKRHLSEITRNGSGNSQTIDQKQTQSSCSQHIKSQDVSLIKCKPDEQEDNIIKVYSDSPHASKNEILPEKVIVQSDKLEESNNKNAQITSANKDEKRQTKRSANGEHSSHKKHLPSTSESDRENQILQAYNLLQTSPYTDQRYRQKLRISLKPISEAKCQDKQSKNRKLQPLKESMNFSLNNQSSNHQQGSNSFRQLDDKLQSNTSTINSNQKYPYLQHRPRSSSQKSSPSRQISFGQSNPNKFNFSTLQDNKSSNNFYSQNSFGNGGQMNSFRSSSQNMRQSEDKNMSTDYSILMKNRKFLDQKLYSTQFRPQKSSAAKVNQSLPTQENASTIQNDNNGIKFYDDTNEKTNPKYKIRIFRSNSSKKQNDPKITSIEKIYKRKISCVVESFSPTFKKKQTPNSPRQRQKKKIGSLTAKDISIGQNSNRNSHDNEGQALSPIKEGVQS